MSSPHSLTDYLRAAFCRKLVIFSTAIVFAVAAFFAAKRLPNLYQASASITVEASANEPAMDGARRFGAIQQRLASRELLEPVITKSGLLNDSSSPADDLIAQMRAEIRVAEDVTQPGQFNIAYRAKDPEAAQAVVAALTAALVADSAKAAPAASPKIEGLRQRAIALSAELRQLEEKDPRLITLKDGASAATAAPPPRSAQPSADALRAQQMTLESLKDRQYLIQQQLADVDRRVASQKQIVEQQKKSSTLNSNPTYAALIARRAELQGQRDTLINRQELTDKHPRVAAIIDQINAINRQIDELRAQDASQVSQSPEARELMTLESERNRLKLELEINNREMARRALPAPASVAAPVPAAPRDASVSRLAVQYFSLKRSYEETMAKLDAIDAKSTTDTGAKGERFRVLNPANVSPRPVWPSRWLLVLAALAAGLMLGICLALVAERRRFASLQDARDVDFYTRLPLLAAIPKTVTAADQQHAARRARLRFALGTFLTAVATLALAEIFILTNLFALIAKN